MNRHSWFTILLLLVLFSVFARALKTPLSFRFVGTHELPSFNAVKIARQTSPNQVPIDKKRIKTIFNHFRDKPARYGKNRGGDSPAEGVDEERDRDWEDYPFKIGNVP
jgi:hypothetical protein